MTLDPNMSGWISMKIYDELSKCCGMLCLDGADRRIYELCMKDFWDYMGYLKRNHIKVENEDLQNQPIIEFQIQQDAFGYTRIHTEIKGINSKEVDEFVHMYVQQWWKKYHERTKIVFNVDEKLQLLMDMKPSCDFTEIECREILGTLTDHYIKYGEICCPSILADQLFKRTVKADTRKTWTVSDKINLIAQLKREAKQISYTHGTLIFIKPDKQFFLREWRDSNANRVV